MVWAAVIKSGRIPLVFVTQGVKIKQENYRKGILAGSLLPLAEKHFKKHSWLFQQSPSHEAKKRMKKSLSANVPNFISKKEWLPSSADLNRLDFGIWSYHKRKVSVTHHKRLEALKAKRLKEWAKIKNQLI